MIRRHAERREAELEDAAAAAASAAAGISDKNMTYCA